MIYDITANIAVFKSNESGSIMTYGRRARVFITVNIRLGIM